MPFRIIRNDITKVAADAIVNTANPEPMIGGGTDWAVHTAAGPELLEARRRIGPLRPGECAATPAFGLPARYVLHTVSPVWIDGRHGEEALLRRAYDAALQQAAALGCASVAFPLMAAGTYGFPHDAALSTAVGAFTDFLLDHEMLIELVLFNADAFGRAASLFEDLRSYVDEEYVDARTQEEYLVDNLPQSSAEPCGRPAAPRRTAEPRRPRERRMREKKDFTAAPFFDLGAPEETGGGIPASHAASLEELLRLRESSFREYLRDLLRERGGKDSEVYKRAEISRQLFSKILNTEDYQPTKSTVIQLAIGLQLDLAQTQKLLGKAGYTLTRSSRRDLTVQYCIERKIYSVSFINEALYDGGLPLLTTGMRA